MPRESTGRLFDEPEEGPSELGDAPLADRMRPRALAEFVGQTHLVGAGKPLRRLIEQGGKLPSLIVWGAPGTGKTTLARLLATQAGAEFIPLSAVFAGVREVRAAIDEARRTQRRGGRTILFIDEIHRFNKAQQDALLPAVEGGTVTLIGATTENPSFEVTGALLSRCRVVSLNPLSEDDLALLILRALDDRERGLADLHAECPADVLARLAQSSGGDARVALTALESAVQTTAPDPDGVRRVTEETVVEALGRARYAYDKGGEDHYNLASALIKSLRNSDVNAALFWLARLIEGGADPIFIARRLCILASEDIGMADPQAMVQAASAAQITRLIGLPEALYPLSQATIYLARAPKSNAVKRAYHAAAADAAASAREPVPLHLRNAVTPLMAQAGYGQGYRYAHNDPAAREEMPCLPERFRGRRYCDEEAPDQPPRPLTDPTNPPRRPRHLAPIPLAGGPSRTISLKGTFATRRSTEDERGRGPPMGPLESPPDEAWWERQLLRNEKDAIAAPERFRRERLQGNRRALHPRLPSGRTPNSPPEDFDDDDDEMPYLPELDETDDIDYRSLATAAMEFTVAALRRHDYPVGFEEIRNAALRVTTHLAGGHGIGYDDGALCGNIVKCRWALADGRFCIDALQTLVHLRVRPEFAGLLMRLVANCSQ